MSHLASSSQDLLLAAIKLMTRIAHNSDLCSLFTGSQVKTVITRVCDASNTSKDKTIAVMSMWFISMQNFSAAQISKSADEMFRAAIAASSFPSKVVQSECLSAISRLQEQVSPKISVRTAVGNEELPRGWFHVVYTSMFNENEKVRNKAGSICSKVVNLIPALENNTKSLLHAQATEDLTNEPSRILQRLKTVESELQKEKPDSTIKSYIRGWGWLCCFLGGQLVKSGKINEYCNIFLLSFS
eukprot:751494-Hanusia_phi.AAC.2